MDEALRRMLRDGDEAAIDDAYFDDECPHFFAVDWREDDAAIVEYCADCLGIDSLGAEWRDDSLVIVHGAQETLVPLEYGVGNRHITISTLNEVLQPEYEIRLLICSLGSDTAGFAALPAVDWQTLEREFPEATEANFLKLADTPNIFVELTDGHLPSVCLARFQRMIKRNRNS